MAAFVLDASDSRGALSTLGDDVPDWAREVLDNDSWVITVPAKVLQQAVAGKLKHIATPDVSRPGIFQSPIWVRRVVRRLIPDVVDRFGERAGRDALALKCKDLYDMSMTAQLACDLRLLVAENENLANDLFPISDDCALVTCCLLHSSEVSVPYRISLLLVPDTSVHPRLFSLGSVLFMCCQAAGRWNLAKLGRFDATGQQSNFKHCGIHLVFWALALSARSCQTFRVQNAGRLKYWWIM